ncbi:hypothetical protein CC86DRAFT_144721 [Ophiobolus disseminans]|uniref:Uncharacterized protein n=1 Tax=Ophiobolus disseminans TaxID=1469910 RepID=A0A6A6ZDY5_9PLEO|nr:hypothetical protein CC86DRAFT_144721 [Ophiobolus disseminans]
MANYVDRETQTKWARLMQCESVRPDALLSPPHDTPTPPDDMLTEKPQFVYGGAIPRIASPELRTSDQPSGASSLVDRRRNPVGLNPHIDLFSPPRPRNDELGDDGAPDAENPPSPPPTNALLSPLPEANRRHAGHTPLIPRSPSIERDTGRQLFQQQASDDGSTTPDGDKGLRGALQLPTNPTDGAQDHFIGLEDLDHRLGRIAKQQKILRGEFEDEPTPKPDPKPRMDSVEMDGEGFPLSRKGSADSRRPTAPGEIDGITLKTPPSNFGAPFGQL